jgi:hypothetical protein
MTARDWVQIAALTSTLGLTGAAIAQNTEGTTSTEYTASELTSSMDTPSSGAIVTPEDKALGMGQDDEQAGNRNGDLNDDTSNTLNNDDLSINPGTSNDDESSVKAGRADMDRASPRYGAPSSPSVMDRDSTSTLDETMSAPARTGSDVQPGNMGPGNMRGQ